VHGLQPARALLALRTELLDGTAALTALALRLMNEHPWDPMLMAFGTLHRGGHKLWDGSNLRAAPGEAEAEQLAGALRDLYVACDRAIGRLIEAAAPEVTVVVFSLHGMGPNTSRTAVLPLLLDLVLKGHAGVGPAKPRRQAVLSGLRERVPDAWRGALKRRLPVAARDQLSTFWRLNGIDWSTTAAVSLMSDLHGYIRVNRRGREAQGIVEPGRNFEAFRDRIAAGLESFVDADTGEPVVARSIRPDDELAPGARSASLPDLLVRWSDTPACRHRALRSPGLGSVRWPTPGLHPDGRSGNHRFEGFLLGAGPGLQGALDLPAADFSDLAPTMGRSSGWRPIRPWSGDLCSPGDRSRHALTRTTSTERRARPAFPVIGDDAGFGAEPQQQSPEKRRVEGPETTKSYPGRGSTRGVVWWSRGESNPRPLECDSSALPTELRPRPAPTVW
jgi:predicted AlkP superfamily phosphohydrolase/phosphomutase